MSGEPSYADAPRFGTSAEAKTGTSAVETSGPVDLNPAETQTLQMYESWVELDKSVFQAHDDLQRILKSPG